jgi:FkbM family methyltransferase
MRAELFYNPLLLLHRLGQWAAGKRRLRRLRNSVAASLQAGHIDSLELLELLRPQKPLVIFDIGANVGTWTLLAKALYPAAQVHAFEPLQIHIEKFRQLTSKLTGVSLHEVGLGSHPARATMKVTSFSDASSLLPLSVAGKEQWHLQQVAEIPVQIERLDDWVSSRGLPGPDVIKLDVQGFELEVLRGAEQCLIQARWVLLEASFKDFYEGQCRFDQLVTFLASAGFQVLALGQGTALGEPLVQSDVLFARSDPVNKQNKASR